MLISEETPSLNALAPSTIGGSPVMVMLEVEDVDAVAAHAVDARATVKMPVQEMFWGERYASSSTHSATDGRSPLSTWDRLAEVKARYDPRNLFRLNQHVRPADS